MSRQNKNNYDNEVLKEIKENVKDEFKVKIITFKNEELHLDFSELVKSKFPEVRELKDFVMIQKNKKESSFKIEYF